MLVEIAKAILINKDIINLLKKIGYYKICYDIHDFVIQLALLKLFPQAPHPEWIRPETMAVVAQLTELTDLGFSLSYSLIIDIFRLFIHHLENIGEILVESFRKIKRESLESFIYKCSIEAQRPLFKSKNRSTYYLLEDI